MKTLGRAFQEYANDHKGALPPAAYDDGKRASSWDREIAVYLEPELGKQNPSERKKVVGAKSCAGVQMPVRPGAARRSDAQKLCNADV